LPCTGPSVELSRPDDIGLASHPLAGTLSDRTSGIAPNK
jgi:hypothetical protein